MFRILFIIAMIYQYVQEHGRYKGIDFIIDSAQRFGWWIVYAAAICIVIFIGYIIIDKIR